jgi:fatty acid desaturase
MHFNRLIWGTLLYLMIIPFLSMRLARPDQKARIIQEYAVLAVAAAAILCLLPLRWVALGWALPFLFTNWMINLRGFSQHGITDAKDPLLASRSILPNPLVRFFLINENFHLEHHLFPAVPGCNLQDLHFLLRPRIPRRTLLTSYSAFLFGFLRQARTMNNRPIGIVQSDDAPAVREGNP